jgi:prepilin signal peptidase PulO-like enzyme (type II secretory pathway)
VFEVWEIKIWNTIFFLFQAACSVYDIRIRAVPRWLLLLGSALTAAARIAGIGEGTWVYIWGAFVGIGFLIVSRCTKEALGYADSWMIFLLGMYLGIWKLVSALSFSFLAAGIWSLGKVVLKKKGRKEVIPFLPFLTAGYLGGIVW